MKFFFKKQIAAMACTVVAISSFSMVGYAAPDYGTMAAEVGYVYSYVDDGDKTAINSAYARFTALEASSVDGAVDKLLTDGFGKSVAAEEKLVKLLSNSMATYFAASESDLYNKIVTADAAVSSILEGIGITDDEKELWFDLFLRTKKDSERLATWQDKWILAVGAISQEEALASLEPVYETLDKLQVKAIEERLAGGLADEFEALGWTAENLVEAGRNIYKAMDTTNKAEYALVKAAARSSAVLTVNGEEYSRTTGYDAGKDLSKYFYKIAPGESLTGTISLEVMGTEVAHVVGYASEGNVNVSFSQDNEAKTISFAIENAEKGTADIIIKRDPLGNDATDNSEWIVRFRVIVANDIARVNQPVWDDQNEGRVFWDAVANAEKYIVVLYKNDVKIAEKTVQNATETNFAEELKANGNGEYRAIVTAYGTTEYEVGEPSEPSEWYPYISNLPAVENVRWVQEDNKTSVAWDAVTGADTYIVKIYADANKTTLVETKTVTDNTCDCTQELADRYGTFYATVEAKNADGKTSGESELSPALKLVRLNKLTGKATLEGYVKGSSRDDNSGIAVTIVEEGETVYTDEDGNYAFEDIEDGTYTITFSKKYHLTRTMRNVKIESADKAIEDTCLYFGELYTTGQVIINHRDLSTIVSVWGLLKDEPGYDADMDINGDDIIDVEEINVIVRNINKTPAIYNAQ